MHDLDALRLLPPPDGGEDRVNPLAAGIEARRHLQDPWLVTQKLRRSMVDPDREPLEGVVEVDQAEIPFREGDAFFEPGNACKILVIGAVEVIRSRRQSS